MREILFKAKRIDNGEWVEGSYLYCKKATTVSFINEHYILVFDGYGVAYHEIDKDTICQYTGLTDKNGKKIWENDIVCVCDIDHAIAIYSEKHSGYILQPIEDYYFDSPMLVDNIDIINKVIGNISDNLELLKAGDKHE